MDAGLERAGMTITSMDAGLERASMTITSMDAGLERAGMTIIGRINAVKADNTRG
jgi:hypothetical protein